MVALSPASMAMSGRAGDAALVDIRSIGGLNEGVNRKLSQQVCRLLADQLAIAPERIYVNFTDVDAGSWGRNGSTFG